MKCSRCECEIVDNLQVEIALSINAQRIKENGIAENVPNSSTTSREVLCFECFDEFSRALETLNFKYKEM